MDMSGERSCKSSLLASENKTKYVWTLCQTTLISFLHLFSPEAAFLCTATKEDPQELQILQIVSVFQSRKTLETN